jgi:hypothetical protein
MLGRDIEKDQSLPPAAAAAKYWSWSSIDAMAVRSRAIFGAFGGSRGRKRGSPEVAETVMLTSVERLL